MCDECFKITAFHTSDHLSCSRGYLPKATNCLSSWCIKATGQGGTSWHLHVKNSNKEWNHRRPLDVDDVPCFVTDSCFSSNVLESKLGGLTVCNASHLSLLSKCKISQCQLGQSPTRVGGASYQAPLAQLPPPACSHPCTRWRINKTSATLWGPACCVIGKLKSEMS